MTENVFAALPPPSELLLIGGETLEISPLKVGELPAFARAVRPVALKISADPDWIGLLSEQGESVLQALAIACRRPPDWVASLHIDEAIRLAEAVFGANADFFIHRVVPEITRVSQQIGSRGATLISGLMPSPGSSEAGTATPTS